MIDPYLALQAVLQGSNLKINPFPQQSRYYGLEIATVEDHGRIHVYVRRRFLPNPDRFAPLQEHAVSEGERLDTITSRYFTDPQLFWKICDANNAMHPGELTEVPGRRLRITLPEGIPVVPNA